MPHFSWGGYNTSLVLVKACTAAFASLSPLALDINPRPLAECHSRDGGTSLGKGIRKQNLTRFEVYWLISGPILPPELLFETEQQPQSVVKVKTMG